MVAMFIPSLAKLLKLSIFGAEGLLFLGNVVKDAVAHRRKAQIKRGDLIDLLIETLDSPQSKALIHEKNGSVVPSEGQITKEELETILIANVIVLFFSGFDTTSTTASVALAFLAKYPDVQEKLFQEINDALEENESSDLDYETVQELPYLDMVWLEMLRVYAGFNIERQCSKDYKISGTDFTVPKGMLVQINGSVIHRDQKYFPDPDNFNPEENFSPEAKAQRPPYAFLAFGQGPRGCIGMRFANLMVKMFLVKILANYKVVAGPSQPKEIVMSATNFNGMPEGGVWCKVEKR